jgi:hypothetical protein
VPYVTRDDLGVVVARFYVPQFKGQEFLEDGHPDLQPKAEEVTKERLTNIKQRAREVILSRYPDWKQQNMTAHAVELLKKFATRTITPEEQAVMEHYETTVWPWIKAVRAASDAAERDGLTADQVEWPR